jgi:hypothetical protein
VKPGLIEAEEGKIEMKVIGAGCPRTGTLSTQAALTLLGMPCYHMAEIAIHEEHTRAWHAFLVEKKAMDWEALFKNYEATVDAPPAFFYREILQAFPDAKVLLNLRDGESWYKSYLTLHGAIQELMQHRENNARLNMWLQVVETLDELILGQDWNQERCIRTFHEHNRRVQEEVPPDRLLVFRVQEGWGPLCEFLGCEVPDEPFPHLNEGADTVKAGLSLIFGLV